MAPTLVARNEDAQGVGVVPQGAMTITSVPEWVCEVFAATRQLMEDAENNVHDCVRQLKVRVLAGWKPMLDRVFHFRSC